MEFCASPGLAPHNLGSASTSANFESSSITTFRRLLDSVNYRELYKSAVPGLSVWTDFRRAVLPRYLSRQARAAWSLFYEGQPVSTASFAELFSDQYLTALTELGVISRNDDLVRATVLVLAYRENYITLDHPAKYANGTWGPGRIYFDAVTLTALDYLVPQTPVDHFLEVGTGSGMILIEASKRARIAIGIDLDPTAAFFSQLNVTLNDRQSNTAVCVGNLMDCLNRSPSFDAIAFHPPYRVVPQGILYPNPVARVGAGEDGLDLIRSFLRGAIVRVRPHGSIRVACEVPASDKSVPFFDELKQFGSTVASDISIDVLGQIDIERQATITSEKCAHMNPALTTEQIKNLVLQHYLDRHYSMLISCVISVVANPAAA
jgi:Ribosomal protein L11 methyltransferase (PrmA)